MAARRPPKVVAPTTSTTDDASQVASATAPAIPVLPAAWLAKIEPFATTCGLSVADVTDALKSLVGEPNAEGAELLGNEEFTPSADLKACFSGVPGAKLNKAIAGLRDQTSTPALPINEVVAGVSAIPNIAVTNMFTIPDVMEGSDFLSALSASKSLVVDELSIRSALEALYADSLGLSSIPERLCDMIEAAADEAEIPVSESVTDLLRFVRERRYAEVNVESRLVTKERKAKVLDRLRDLPKVMYQFHQIVISWYTQLEQLQRSNPLGILSPQGRQYPPVDDVIGGAELVVACLTRAFGGFGVQVARAMAYEGMKIRETLQRSDLPQLTGSVTREKMLKDLGVNLTNADVRTERAIASYVLFVATQVPTKLPVGQEGPAIEALFNLGQRVAPWMQHYVSGTDQNSRRNGRSTSHSEETPLGGPSASRPAFPARELHDDGRHKY